MLEPVQGRGQSSDAVPIECEIFVLNEQQIEHYWPVVSAALDEDPTLWCYTFTKEGIFRRLLSGTVLLWSVCEKDGPITTIFMTNAYETETSKVLNVFWMSGKRTIKRLPVIVAALERYCNASGLDRIEISGRKGWERALAAVGGEYMCSTICRPVSKEVRN